MKVTADEMNKLDRPIRIAYRSFIPVRGSIAFIAIILDSLIMFCVRKQFNFPDWLIYVLFGVHVLTLSILMIQCFLIFYNFWFAYVKRYLTPRFIHYVKQDDEERYWIRGPFLKKCYVKMDK